MKYEAIIGLEIHVQLKTKSKMFCSCDNSGEDKPANTTICPVCTGQPGTLPVANQKAIDFSVMAAMALNCFVPPDTHFDRKSYFYPDLPKGYQISQYTEPIGRNGYLEIDVAEKKRKIKINDLHLEEDTGKLIHAKDKTFIDFNRAGTPLMEIVTEPDLRSPEEARIFLQDLRLIMRYLGISEADMEKGQLRADANISLRFKGDAKLYPKTEIKNLNSFKSVEKGLQYEIERQTDLWDQKKAPKISSTRGWDEKKGITVEQRTKEAVKDYRYFPEADLPALHFDKSYLSQLKSNIPELPAEKRKRFMEDYLFEKKAAEVLISDLSLSNYAESVLSELKNWLQAESKTDQGLYTYEQDKKEFSRLIANWLINRLLSLVNEEKIKINSLAITPENFAEFILIIYKKRINNLAGQEVLKIMFETGGDPSNIMEEKCMGLMADEASLIKVIETVIKENPGPVKEYKEGKEATFKFLIGQVMKVTRGQADHKVVSELLLHKLK
ncbi:MAG: Asp-tRNA(Asn)/Glu-tRNA(Gln) amidotransferase subunit GatB [Patescibacteria group bacterium]